MDKTMKTQDFSNLKRNDRRTKNKTLTNLCKTKDD